MNENKRSLKEYGEMVGRLLDRVEVTDGQGLVLSRDAGAQRAVDMILAIKVGGRKVMTVGNGGSAAIASHLQNDLSKAVGVRALAFYESSLLTALANDHGYGCVFERPIKQWAQAGDLLIAISSSGNSENIVRAAREAQTRGCGIISLSGFKPDNTLRALGNLNFYVPVDDYGLVETVHAVLGHYFTDLAQLGQN